MFEEWNERNLREKNIVIYGVNESSSNIIDERIKHDRQFVEGILTTCGVKTGHGQEQGASTNSHMGKLVRLDKRTEGKKKGRPLLVGFTHEHVKKDLFSKISKLKGNSQYESINIAHDLTKLQREREAFLYEEAKNKTGCIRGGDIQSKRPFLEAQGSEVQEKNHTRNRRTKSSKRVVPVNLISVNHCVNSVDNVYVLFSNVDVLTNDKLDELEARINDVSRPLPQVI